MVDFSVLFGGLISLYYICGIEVLDQPKCSTLILSPELVSAIVAILKGCLGWSTFWGLFCFIWFVV